MSNTSLKKSRRGACALTTRITVVLGLAGVLALGGCPAPDDITEVIEGSKSSADLGAQSVTKIIAGTFEGRKATISLPDALRAAADGELQLTQPPPSGAQVAAQVGEEGGQYLEYTPPAGFIGEETFRVAAGGAKVDVQLSVYPQVHIALDVVDGPRDLSVRATASTLDGSPLPDGVYTWSYDGVKESGPLSTHASRELIFRRGGVHALALTITIAGLSGPIACRDESGETAQVTVWPQITGHVRDEAGQGIAAVEIYADGGLAARTGADGSYRLTVSSGWSGQLHVEHPRYHFADQTREFLDLREDLAGQDFVGQAKSPETREATGAQSQPAGTAPETQHANQPPVVDVAQPAAFAVAVNSERNAPRNRIELMAHDPDNDQAELEWILVTAPVHGAAGLTVDGSGRRELWYEPQPGFTGDDLIGVSVRDGAGGEESLLFSVLVGDLLISGKVRNYEGATQAGARVILAGTGEFSGQTFQVQTNGEGRYECYVPAGWCGITVSDQDHNTAPASRSYWNLTASPEHQNFTLYRNWYVATNGHDQNGGTRQNPMRTLQEAVDRCAPGDAVVVRGGTYTSGSGSANTPIVHVPAGGGGLEGHPLKIRAMAGEAVVLDGNDCTRTLVRIEGSWIDFEGFELMNGLRTAVDVEGSASTTHHINIRNCYAHDNTGEAYIGAGFRTLGPVQYVLFEDCISTRNSGGFQFRETPTQTAGTASVPPIAGNTGYTVDLPESMWSQWEGWTQYGARYCTIRRCVASDNLLFDEHSDGIALRYGIDCVIEDSVAFGNADDNFDLLAAVRCTLRRNISFDANPLGTYDGDGNGMKIGVRGGLECVVERNLVFQNPRAGIDMADTERARVYHNTIVNNGWFGLWLEAERGTQDGAVILNNACLANGVLSSHGDMGKWNCVAISACDYNSISDSNQNAWAIPMGPHSLLNMNPQLVEASLQINRNWPRNASNPDKLAFVWVQAEAQARLQAQSPLVDRAVLLGVNNGFLGAGADIGAIESH